MSSTQSACFKFSNILDEAFFNSRLMISSEEAWNSEYRCFCTNDPLNFNKLDSNPRHPYAVMWSHRSVVHSEGYAKPTTLLKERPDRNTRNYMPYSFRLVCGIFNVPQSLWTLKGSETGPTVYSPYPRRLESLTILRMSSQRQHFLPSYFKTLTVGPVGVELTTSRMAARCSTNWATGAR